MSPNMDCMSQLSFKSQDDEMEAKYKVSDGSFSTEKGTDNSKDCVPVPVMSRK